MFKFSREPGLTFEISKKNPMDAARVTFFYDGKVSSSPELLDEYYTSCLPDSISEITAQRMQEAVKEVMGAVVSTGEILEVFRGLRGDPEVTRIYGIEESGVNAGFFNARGHFIAKKLGDLILSQYAFRTTNDNETIYCFCDDGTWKPSGEAVIKNVACEKLGHDYTEHRVREVMGYIKHSTLISRSEFDNNINLMAVKNGVLDLEKGELLEHNPDYMMTVRLPVKYDPQATMPNTLKFLAEVLSEDDIPLVQELFGFCLWREYQIHKSFMLVGKGSNGKSTLLNLLKVFLGPENVANATLQALDQQRFASSGLYGKLACINNDIPHRSLFETGMFKQLCGGDTISAERKFKDSFSFSNYAKLVFACNQLPETKDDSHAFFRRWVILKFENTFEGPSCNPYLLSGLTQEAELSGLLNWALVGLRRLRQSGGFSNSKSTVDMQDEYERMSSPVAGFVKDILKPSSGNTITKDDMYQSFTDYCEQNELPTMDISIFGKRLQRYASFLRTRKETVGPNKRKNVWVGASLESVQGVKGVNLFSPSKTHARGSKQEINKLPCHPGHPGHLGGEL